MSVQVRALSEADRSQITALLNRQPVANVFVAANVALLGFDPSWRGWTLWGYLRDNELLAMCFAGTNVVPVEANELALRAFVEVLGPRRAAQSIMGRRDSALNLHRLLAERWGDSWSRCRAIRANQLVMVKTKSVDVVLDQRVQRVRPDQIESYFDAAVKVYAEEIGVSPLDDGQSYRRYLATLIGLRRAFGAHDFDGFWFKSDIGAAWGSIGQIQGVWIDPALRGKGFGVPAVARAVELAGEEFETISLYVNDFNLAAIKVYEKIGFSPIDSLATVLY